MTARTRLVLLGFLTALVCLLVAGSAAAASPWWNLNTSIRPATIPTGGEGTIVVRSSNLGDAPTSNPSNVGLTLPPQVSVVNKAGVPQVQFYAYSVGQDLGPMSTQGASVESCKVTSSHVDCSTEAQNPASAGLQLAPPLNPYEFIEIRVAVKDEGATSGAPFQAEASGGGSTAVTRSRPLPIGPEPVAFGAEEVGLVPEAEGGAPATRAASHPFQLSAIVNLKQLAEERPNPKASQREVKSPALPRDVDFNLPPGQIGNATALPQCSTADFSTRLIGNVNLCPGGTALGVATVTLTEPNNLGVFTEVVPIFNLEPAFGEPARFGFTVASSPVILDTSVRSAPGPSGEPGDYGVTVAPHNISQAVNLLSSTVTFWGSPGDPLHNASRGWGCIAGEHFTKTSGADIVCETPPPGRPVAFLTLPSDCTAPFAGTLTGASWPTLAAPGGFPLAAFPFQLEDGAGNPLSLSACNQVPFDPQIHSEPTSNAATSPTGLAFEINFGDEGLTNPEGIAQSQLKKALVTLPQGFTTNPSVAEGLKACSEAEYEAATLEANSGCTSESKIGEVEVTSPLVQPNQKLVGGLYVARQTENPNHNLLTLYLIARNAEIGVLIKQALKVVPDPVTGQLTTEVDNVPELPFSHFRLFFRPGQRAPLVTPPACGPYAVKAQLTPWSNQTAAVSRESAFQLTQGPEGQPCPSGGTPPFHPNLEAGTLNNAAGTYSPFYTRLSRKDSEQEITHFSIKLPPGVSGKLAGIPECSDAGIAAAKAREHEGGGQEELNSSSCPAASEVGHSLVGSGVGNVLAYAPGKLYLAGPYHGSNLSIVSITAAKVGPFDLGTVVVRFALKIDPETAEVSVDGATSDPIPHIVDGIPVHLRDIRAYVDRPDFVLNPTSCKKTSTASTVLGSGLNFASEADDVPVTVSSPFQAADCASLGFKPNLTLSLKGGTKRGATPAFKAVLTYPKGSYANIAESQVTLPHSEFLEQSHIGTVCTRAQFKEGKIPGEKCPAASVYGRARAVTPILSEPLEGPVYLRSSSHNLPDLVAALHNNQVDIALDGRIDSVENGRIRNTFEAVPDAPVSKFVLEMQGGKKGLLVNSTDICRTKHKAISHFVGQNGKVWDTNPVLSAKCPKAKKGGKGSKSKRHR
ncbi:MAG TPA: hypothetical protein VGO13_00975 [Solirubrobacterales bacterium]|nr:hypothetical protein [Solirubrobacterales bacterium]